MASIVGLVVREYEVALHCLAGNPPQYSSPVATVMAKDAGDAIEIAWQNHHQDGVVIGAVWARPKDPGSSALVYGSIIPAKGEE